MANDLRCCNNTVNFRYRSVSRWVSYLTSQAPTTYLPPSSYVSRCVRPTGSPLPTTVSLKEISPGLKIESNKLPTHIFRVDAEVDYCGLGDLSISPELQPVSRHTNIIKLKTGGLPLKRDLNTKFVLLERRSVLMGKTNCGKFCWCAFCLKCWS